MSGGKGRRNSTKRTVKTNQLTDCTKQLMGDVQQKWQVGGRDSILLTLKKILTISKISSPKIHFCANLCSVHTCR